MATRAFSRFLSSSATLSRPVLRLSYKSARPFSIWFTKSHEYIKIDGGVGTVGISDHAAAALGDVVFVDLPSVGAKFSAGESFGSVESVKAASDVYIPIDGEVLETNSNLETNPGTVNESPFDDGWFIKVKVADSSATSTLLDEAAYKTYLETLDH